MEPQTLPDNIAAKVNQWLGGDYSAAHFWRCGDAFLIVASVPSAADGIYDIYCLRVFPIGDKLELSQDNIIYGR